MIITFENCVFKEGFVIYLPAGTRMAFINCVIKGVLHIRQEVCVMKQEEEFARHQMWCALLGDEYVSATTNRKKQLKRQYCAMVGDDVYPHQINEPISLACCPTAVPCVVEQPKPARIQTKAERRYQEQKENTMGYNNASAQLVVQAAPPADPHEMTRDYLNRRVQEIFWDKRDLADFYHITEDYPKAGQEMVDRILTGKYILHPKSSGSDYDDSRVEWRDPATPADKDGHKKAKELLAAAKQKAMDEITVLWPEEGLAALREFEKYDPTVEVPYTVH